MTKYFQNCNWKRTKLRSRNEKMFKKLKIKNKIISIKKKIEEKKQ